MHQMTLVPSGLIQVMWGDLAPHLQKVIKKNPDELTLDGIKQRLENGDESLLVISSGSSIVAVVTIQTQTYDTGKKALCILLAGGEDCAEWQEQLTGVMDNLARHFGCFQIRGLGARAGWTRSSSNSLFKVKNLTLYRNVEGVD